MFFNSSLRILASSTRVSGISFISFLSFCFNGLIDMASGGAGGAAGSGAATGSGSGAGTGMGAGVSTGGGICFVTSGLMTAAG